MTADFRISLEIGLMTHNPTSDLWTRSVVTRQKDLHRRIRDGSVPSPGSPLPETEGHSPVLRLDTGLSLFGTPNVVRNPECPYTSRVDLPPSTDPGVGKGTHRPDVDTFILVGKPRHTPPDLHPSQHTRPPPITGTVCMSRSRRGDLGRVPDILK